LISQNGLFFKVRGHELPPHSDNDPSHFITVGGSPSVEREDGKLFIRSVACPLSAAVVKHPEVCELAEELVSEIVGLPVREHCGRGESPKCCFELKDSE
jgi:predicted ArsR family transcriptional regulator